MDKALNEIDIILEVFPFAIVLDQSFSIQNIGRSLKKITGQINKFQFLDQFQIQRPHLEYSDFEIIKALVTETFYIKHIESNLLFRGQFRLTSNQKAIVFLASLWVMDIEHLKPYKITISDFASHDPTFDYLHVLKQSDIHKNELKDLVSKIDIQSAFIKKSNTELNNAKTQLESILNEMSDVVWSVKIPEMEVLFITPFVNKLYEIDIDQCMSDSSWWEKNIHQDDRNIIKVIYEELESKGHFNKKYRIETPSGNVKWVRSRGKYIYDENQNPKRLDVVIVDRTKEYLAQQTLDQELKLQEALIDIASTYINIDPKDIKNTINSSLAKMGLFVSSDRAYIFDYDFDKGTTSNTFEWCNAGIDPEIENLQQMPIEFFPQWVEQHQKGEPFYIPDVSILVDTGEGGLKSILAAQGIKSLIAIPLLDGKELIGFVGFDSVKKHYKYSDKEKRLLFLFGQMLINIRNRQKWENQLRLQEEKYRNIIANMNLGLLEVMPDETIIFANQSFCDMSGYTLEELKGEKATKFLLNDDDQELLNEKLKLRKKGESDSYEIAVKNKQGEIRWWFISGAPNYNDRNELIGSIGIHLDITDQKKLEKELEKAKLQAEDASQAKESFLANMSHEIRTPLNAIIGMIRELGREDLTPKQNSYVSHSDTAARHLLTIVNNILDMSKIEAGELIIDEKEFSLMSVIGNVISILQNKAQEKKLQLNYSISKEIKPSLIGDAGRVRQILINFIGNAIKFTDRGNIDLSVKVNHTNQYFQQLNFEIKDSGIGMNKEYLHQIFNKFSQEEGSAARKYEGTGLGMTISREMIYLMGGDCDIQSEKGIGTTVTFNLTLPVGDESKLIDKDSYLVDNSLASLKILLVEDNEMNSFIACKSLQYFGCKVDTASNGREAIEKLTSQKPDLILMDIQMPEMDGIEATKYIRNEMAISTPIIALTANAFKKDIDLYLSIGMNDYVTKPFEEDVLFNTIANTLNIKTKTPTASGTIHQNTTSEEIPLFDLTNIKTLSRGDQSFVNKMIEIFIDHTPTSMVEIKNAYKLQDFITISKIAHRMKPSIDNMGIHSLKNPIRELESTAKTEVVDKEKVSFLIDIIENTLEKVIGELKARD